MINISLDDNKSERLLNEQKYENTPHNPNELSAIEKLTQVGREATKYNFEEMALSPDCDNGISGFSDELFSEMSKYDLQSYYVTHLEERTKFFKKLSPDVIMRWSSDLITKPLTKIPSNLVDFALQLFKNLLSYMGDRKSSKQPINHIRKHLKFTINASQELKDEAYVQALKQITAHPDYDKCIRGWNFLAIMAASFAPGVELYYSILNFLYNEAKSTTDENIRKHANYTFVRLVKSFENKRRQIPSDEEIMHLEHMKPIMFPVYFLSDTHTFVPTESYTTVKELKSTIMRKIQFNVARIPYYCLYEICNKKDSIEERFLDDSDKIVDVVAMWDKEKDDFMKRNEVIEFKIYLKIQLFYTCNETDNDTITMMYVQTMYEVITGRFNLKDVDIVTLASLQLLVDYGVDHEKAYQNLQKNIEKYVPFNKLNETPASSWIQKIMDFYAGLKMSSKLETKLTYLEHLKQSPLWQSHQFYVKYSSKLNSSNQEKTFPESCIIAIKPKGISVLDLDRNELDSFSYNVIASWGVSNTVFVCVISKVEGELTKYYFETPQTKIFQYLIEAYTNLIVGKSINETMSSALASIKKFDTMSANTKGAINESYRSRISTSFKKK